MVHDASFAGLVRAGLRGLSGRGLSRARGVTYRTGRCVAIESASAVQVEVDGDWFGTTPVAIRVEPARVPIVVPA
jgi:diacylglycerol kinase family enzyme